LALNFDTTVLNKWHRSVSQVDKVQDDSNLHHDSGS
jgi:hypothetical protein